MFIIFSRALWNNTKSLENAMIKDENGVWLYEELNVQLNGNDSFEYWLFVENNNLGYVTNGVIRIGGFLFFCLFHKLQ